MIRKIRKKLTSLILTAAFVMTFPSAGMQTWAAEEATEVSVESSTAATADTSRESYEEQSTAEQTREQTPEVQQQTEAADSSMQEQMPAVSEKEPEDDLTVEETAPTVEAASYDTYKTKCSLYMRQKADKTSTALAVLPSGATIYIREEVKIANGDIWGKLVYNGKTGWTSLKFCTKVSAGTETRHITDTAATTAAPVTTTKASAVTTTAGGESKPEAVTTTEGTTTSTTETAKAATTAELGSTKTYEYKVNISYLNMRAGAGTSYNILAILSMGKQVTVTEISANNWGKITYKGKTGWISLKYCKKISENTVTTTAVTAATAVITEKTTTSTTENASTASTAATAKDAAVTTEKAEATTTVTNAATTTEKTTVTTTEGTKAATTAASAKKYMVNASSLNVRSGADTNYSILGQLASGAVVAVSEISSNNWGKIAYNGKIGWISLSYCSDVSDQKEETGATTSTGTNGWVKVGSTMKWYTNGSVSFSDNGMYTAWTKIKNKYSGTRYYLVVDTPSCKVYIFTGSANNWVPYKVMQCSPGATSTPTVKGTFTIQDRGYSFGTYGSYTCYYWTRFYNGYLFHSVLYYWNSKTIKDGRLGMHLSHGCVRLAIGNAQWIYNNVGSGSKVLVY